MNKKRIQYNIKDSVVLITGGAGFLGCNLTRRLLDLGCKKIYIIDDLSSGNKQFVPNDKRVIFKHCDISNFEKCSSVIEDDVEFVFHLAAHFANQNSVDFPISDIQTNVIGTTNILKICKDKNIKKFIYTSSSCVYGNQKIMDEHTSVYPTETPYAINKLCSEMYVKYFAEIYNVPTLSVRIFNTFGPYELPGPYRNVIPNFISKALSGDDITITGTGDETRDFTYVDNSLDLMIKMCESDLADGSVYNAGTGCNISINYLAEKIIEYTDSKSKIKYVDRRNWDAVTKRVSDISLSKDVFDYNPCYSFEDGLLETVKWIKSC